MERSIFYQNDRAEICFVFQAVRLQPVAFVDMWLIVFVQLPKHQSYLPFIFWPFEDGTTLTNLN